MGWTNDQPNIITLPNGAISGARVVIDGTNDRILVYDAAGVLIVVLSGSSGSDPVSAIGYGPGLTVFNDPHPGLISAASAGTPNVSPVLSFSSGQTLQEDAQAQSFNLGSGLERFTVFGPINAIDAVAAQALIHLFSSTNSGNNATAQWELQNNHGGTYIFVDAAISGTKFRGTLLSLQPGALSSGVPVVEAWHAATGISALWTTTGAANPLRYQYEAVNGGRVRLDGELLTTGAGPWPANATIFTLPTGYMPAFTHSFITRSDIAVAAGQETVNVLSSGGIQNGQAFTAAGQRLFFDGIVCPID